MRKIVCKIGVLLFLTSCSDRDTDIPTVITGDNVVFECCGDKNITFSGQ